jgi:hypothetical protein
MRETRLLQEWNGHKAGTIVTSDHARALAERIAWADPERLAVLKKNDVAREDEAASATPGAPPAAPAPTVAPRAAAPAQPAPAAPTIDEKHDDAPKE